MKILLALDTSAIAHETFATVQRMFTPADTTVVVLSVVGSNELDVVPSPVLLASVAQNLAVLEVDHVRTHQETVAKTVQALRAAGFTAHDEVRYGDPRHAIIDAAQLHRADLIVVGAHERTALQRLMGGSVASHVATHSPCDVLIVRHRDEL